MSDINFSSYADDNKPYTAADSIEDAIRKLENDSANSSNGFLITTWRKIKINAISLILTMNMPQ